MIENNFFKETDVVKTLTKGNLEIKIGVEENQSWFLVLQGYKFRIISTLEAQQLLNKLS